MVVRVVSSYHSPRTLVPMNWGTSGTVFQQGGGTNPFSVTSQDPNTNAYPIWYATGRAGIDGNFTIALTNGFTPSVDLVVWEYNRAAGKWFRIGANTGSYEATFDATYTLASFSVSESAIILVQSSAAITGKAYMDGIADYNQVGAAQEGF